MIKALSPWELSLLEGTKEEKPQNPLYIIGYLYRGKPLIKEGTSKTTSAIIGIFSFAAYNTKG
jgi:hypothetical protein